MDKFNFLYSKNFYLLSLLIFYFIVSPFLTKNEIHSLFASLLIGLGILACVNLLSCKRSVIITTLILAGLTILGYIIIFTMQYNNIVFAFHLAVNSIFLIFMTAIVIASVARHHEITIDTLLGAVSGYLLIGMTWSYIYLAIDCAQPGAFNYMLINDTFRDKLQHYTYFSYVTLTTLGYGDLLPRNNLSRTFAWLEAATGQIYLAVWISQLVGLHIAQRVIASRK
jgi:hypothetical protein